MIHILFDLMNYVCIIHLYYYSKVEQSQEEVIMKNKQVRKAMIDQDVTIKNLVNLTGYTYSHLCNVLLGHINSIKTKWSILKRF